MGRTITETDIVLFINTIGMTEVLFTNYEFIANESPTKGRVAPGSLVFGMAEGLLTQSTMQGVGLAFLNMTLDIKGPTFAGDTIHVECEVIESRPSNSRPGCGLVRTRNRVVKQDGNTRDLIWDEPHLINYLTTILTLYPGDVIMTGTPSGTGAERNEFLKPGDVVTIELEGVGTLVTPMRAQAGTN